MSKRHARSLCSGVTTVLALLISCHTLSAQQTPDSAPTLDDILQRLETNLKAYTDTVPSFFCDEHVDSQVIPSLGNQDTSTDGIFRLKRNVKPDHSSTLDESRDIRTVNGKPAKADDLDGPVVLKGAFSGGLAIVSLSQKACMRYTLKPIKPGNPDAPYIVQFDSLYESRHPAGCILQESGSGRVVIDPHTMQIKHMELLAPQHVLANPGSSDGPPPPPLIGAWTISVDYAPVLMGGRTFWMPSTIQSSASNRYLAGTRPFVWSFKARYSNYHKLEVSSRLLPPADPSRP